MTAQRKNPLLIIMVFIFLVSLACQVPVSGISNPTSLPTGLPTTVVATLTGIPTSSTTIPAKTFPSTPRPTLPPEVTPHRISTHRIYGLAEFYDQTTSVHFIPRGVNYFMLVPVTDHYEDHLLSPSIYDHNRTQTDFAALTAAGYNTVRILLDGCATGDSCIGLQNGQGLNPAYLDNITDLLNLAKANHLFVLFASQGLPELGGYLAMANRGASGSIDPGRNAQLLTVEGIRASQQYWSDLLGGLAMRQAAFDIILGWELIDEQYYEGDQLPFSKQSGRVTVANGKEYDMSRISQKEALAVDSLNLYIDQLKLTIQIYDPTALVTMGFLAPDRPNTWRENDNRYSVTAQLLEDASLDFFDLHASPGSGLSIAQAAQNFGLNGHVNKPVILGDVGASTWTYPQVPQAAIAIQDWIAASCAYGFSGWLYSSYYPSPAGLLEATWGFVDEHDTLLNTLAPKVQPDACQITVLPGRDLAKGKEVRVSAALPDQTPELAVDGDLATQWSAGGYPEQWIEIDLGSSYSIGEIRLTAGQWPDGRTVHQLWVGGSQDTMRMVQEFTGHTYDFDQLSYTSPAPLKNIRYVRVVTTESPAWVAWREIEVLAPFPATPTPTLEVTPTP